VAALGEVLAEREGWRPLGDADLLRRYARRRAVGTWAMSQATDGLWQLFAGQQPLVRELRNRGLGLVNRIGPVKRWLVAQALDA
jgi:2-polyprenyl-6-methoxyphenol hydroxylase-like FAD-dependent oxidoreductase